MIIETKFNVGDEVFVVVTNEKNKQMEIIGPVTITKIKFKENDIIDDQVPKQLYFYVTTANGSGYWEINLFRTYQEIQDQVALKFKPKPIDA